MNNKPNKYMTMFNKLNQGRKIMFISSCTALLSFFLPWVDVGFATRNGFVQGTVLLFALYAYPLHRMYKERPINKLIVILGSIAGMLLTWLYIESKTMDWFGETINVASMGSYLFILASIGLLVGAIKDKKK